MKRLLLVGGLTALLISSPVVAEQAEPSAPRCLCNVTNLTRCEGTGPTLLHTYLWSQPERRSQWFDVGATFPTRSPEECRALDMLAVPRHIPVFNYYGSLVHGCALVWRNCGVASGAPSDERAHTGGGAALACKKRGESCEDHDECCKWPVWLSCVWGKCGTL